MAFKRHFVQYHWREYLCVWEVCHMHQFIIAGALGSVYDIDQWRSSFSFYSLDVQGSVDTSAT